METNVFLGALWSTHGAAFEVLQQLRANRWQLLLSNHLLLEYEEVAKRYAAEMQLTLGDIDDVLTPSAPPPSSVNSSPTGRRTSPTRTTNPCFNWPSKPARIASSRATQGRRIKNLNVPVMGANGWMEVAVRGSEGASENSPAL